MERTNNKIKEQGLFMLKYIWFLMVILITNLYAEKLLLQNEKYEIYATEDSVKNDMHWIYSHIDKINKLDNIISQYESKCCDCDKIEYPMKFTVKVESNNSFVYESKFVEYHFSENDYISRIISKSSCKDIDSAITYEDLIKRSKYFFEEILDIYGKKNEVRDYDSISVETGNNWYIVNYRPKQKSDVYDNRYAKLYISIETGEYYRFECQIYQKYDMNYKPRISKQEAIKKIAEYFSVDVSDITLERRMYLFQLERFEIPSWVWSAAMFVQKGKDRLFIFLYLDSDTGEIFVNNR